MKNKYLNRKKGLPALLKEFILVEETTSKFITKEYNWGLKFSQRYLSSIDNDVKNTVFSYIPNTAEVYFGLIKGCQSYLNEIKTKKILALGANASEEEISEIMKISPRAEKIAIKDAKLRTFITSDESRDDLVAHVYDITYGKVKSSDNLVMIDDSIVRGTTLKQSILRILDRLKSQK